MCLDHKDGQYGPKTRPEVPKRPKRISEQAFKMPSRGRSDEREEEAEEEGRGMDCGGERLGVRRKERGIDFHRERFPQ